MTVEDVPKADCFVVEDRIMVESTKDGGIVLSGWFQIRFLKKTMFRSIIEKATSKEFVEYLRGYGDMVRLATATTTTTTRTTPTTGQRSSSDTSVKVARGGDDYARPRRHQWSRLPWLSFAADKRLLSLG
jgi:hypothetical protein